jgi:hypothetical protein
LHLFAWAELGDVRLEARDTADQMTEPTRRLAGLGDALPALGDRTPRRSRLQNLPPRRTAIAARPPAQAACLADTAREAALDLLGDTEGAVAIAERRLRSEQR